MLANLRIERTVHFLYKKYLTILEFFNMIIFNNKALRKRSNNTGTFQRADGTANQ